MDKLAYALGLDPLDLQVKNALVAGDTTPTQVRLNRSNIGNLGACLEKLKTLSTGKRGCAAS